MITCPPKYTDPKKLEKKVVEYFTQCVEKKKKPTKPGLAYHLGFASRQSVWDLAHRTPNKEIAYIIKRADMLIEDDLCQRETAMSIFQMKAYFGLKDTPSEAAKQTINISFTGEDA